MTATKSLDRRNSNPDAWEVAPRHDGPVTRVSATFPAGLPLGERAAAELRRQLDARGLEDWPVLFGYDVGFADIDTYLKALGETSVQWQPLPAFVDPGHQPTGVCGYRSSRKARLHPAGLLHLHRHEVIIARWHYFAHDRNGWFNLILFSAPTTDHLVRLRRKIEKIQRRRGQRKWQVFTGEDWLDEEVPRDLAAAWDDLVLEPSVRSRLETEVAGFFSAPVAALYKQLGVPYRRGVLMHGPPGNGKTSLIRVIGALNPQIPAIIVRPGGQFTDSNFQQVTDSWRQQAPAMLVIEDLDWLLPRISVSTFLNRIDGINAPGQGMLLVATTNHPEMLDPAINNRPGRFDVVIELASPDLDRRRAFLEQSVLVLQEELPLEEVAAATAELSFAHLREIINLSGLLAVRENRQQRTADDLRRATELVVESHQTAAKGFSSGPEMPFGLGHLVKK